ncbi:MAG: hypothetical protein JNK57_17955 [Planctomycetaceae bacterium]|nr:hypothetical protein [Planctomycetaceae bacterium]
MIFMIVTLVVGLILSAWVVLDALRPKSNDGSFAAPRRKEPNRVWDTIRTDRPAKTEMPSLKQPDQNK